MECSCCFSDIETIVKYRDKADSDWKNCIYCKECIEYMLETQFLDYVEKIKTETCKVALERLIKLGPPLKFRDPKVPCDNETGEVYEFNMFSSKLKNVYEKEQMEKYKDYLQQFII